MAFIHGKNTKLLVSGYNLTEYFQSVQMGLDSPALDITAFGPVYKTFIAGLRFGGTFNLDGLYSMGAGEANAILQAAFLGGTTVGYTYLLDSDTAGNPGFAFSAKATGHAVTSVLDDVVKMSVSNTITLAPLLGVSVAALAQRTAASQTTAALDLGVGASGTLAGAMIQCTAIAGGDTSVVVTIETASNAAMDADLGTIATATVTAVGAYLVPEASMTVRRYVRLKAACGAGETCTVHGLLHYR
jgi:hypothetical protein